MRYENLIGCTFFARRASPLFTQLSLEATSTSKDPPRSFPRFTYICSFIFRGVVKVLLTAGADPTLKTTGGDTPLHIAAASGNASLMSTLLSKKPNVEVKDRAGNTPLLAALDGEQYVFTQCEPCKV